MHLNEKIKNCRITINSDELTSLEYGHVKQLHKNTFIFTALFLCLQHSVGIVFVFLFIAFLKSVVLL